MQRRFENKVVFITGGSTGIGAACGIEFAREGAKVVLAARHEDKLADAVKAVDAVGGTAIAVQCDVDDRQSIDAAVAKTVERFGGIDVVLANAGFGVNGPVVKLTTQDYRRQFDTNFFGVIDTVYATLPHLIASKGRLGIVSSVLGKLTRPNMSAYCASKHALCGFSEAIGYELADLGVSVTCINPGMVASNFQRVDNQNNLRDDLPASARNWWVVPGDRAAREILNALYRRRIDATITGHGRFGVFVYRHFPWLVRFGIRQATRGRLEKFDRSLKSSN